MRPKSLLKAALLLALLPATLHADRDNPDNFEHHSTLVSALPTGAIILNSPIAWNKVGDPIAFQNAIYTCHIGNARLPEIIILYAFPKDRDAQLHMAIINHTKSLHSETFTLAAETILDGSYLWLDTKGKDAITFIPQKPSGILIYIVTAYGASARANLAEISLTPGKTKLICKNTPLQKSIESITFDPPSITFTTQNNSHLQTIKMKSE